MKKTIYRALLSFICSILISYSYAQVIEFPDVHTGGKFNLSVDVIRFSKDSIYNSRSNTDTPNKYHAELRFGKYSFDLRIFDTHNKWVFSISKGFASKEFGKYADQDGFLKSYEVKTGIEHYQYAKQGYDISFQKVASYPDDWIKIHIVASLNQGLSKSPVFFGTGHFLYNTKTREIKQD